MSRRLHQHAVLTIFGNVNHAVAQVNAVFRLYNLAARHDIVTGADVQRTGHAIIAVEHQTITRLLVGENAGLGLYVLIEILVIVQMIGGQVGDRRDGRTKLHAHQLEGGQLDDGQIVRLHRAHLGQQGLADVAAQMTGVTRVLEDS